MKEKFFEKYALVAVLLWIVIITTLALIFGK
jgi:hypothetical protein